MSFDPSLAQYHHFKLSTTDHQTPLTIHCWKPRAAPRGIILIIHGMMEHAKRYDEFAHFLCHSKYAVYAHDQRGHGKTINYKPGHPGDTVTWDTLLSDTYTLIQWIQQSHPNIPITIIGHSMGSFVAMNIAIRYPRCCHQLILSGSSFEPIWATTVGKWLTTLSTVFFPSHIKGTLFHWLIFNHYNRQFAPNRTLADWLSRDPVKVDEAIRDPLTGFVCSVQFFKLLFSGLSHLFKSRTFSTLPKVPILIISGSKDPIAGKSTSKLTQLIQKIKQTQNTKLAVHIYPEARHELINEINRIDVYNDIIKWLDNRP